MFWLWSNKVDKNASFLSEPKNKLVSLQAALRQFSERTFAEAVDYHFYICGKVISPEWHLVIRPIMTLHVVSPRVAAKFNATVPLSDATDPTGVRSTRSNLLLGGIRCTRGFTTGLSCRWSKRLVNPNSFKIAKFAFFCHNTVRLRASVSVECSNS